MQGLSQDVKLTMHGLGHILTAGVNSKMKGAAPPSCPLQALNKREAQL